MPIVPETNAPIITFKEAQRALHDLIHTGEENLWQGAYGKQRDNNECELDAHPFGLNIRVEDAILDQEPRLIASIRDTDGSVRAMKLMLQEHALVNPLAGRTDFRLRIVRIQKPEKNRNDPTKNLHDLYFELITAVGAFICGGCNDYTGGGGYGGKQLESIFRFVAAFYGKPIEEVVIPIEEAEAGIRKMSEAYDALAMRRRERAQT